MIDDREKRTERTSPEFWRGRIEKARAEDRPWWWPVYEVGERDWREVQNQTRDILRGIFRPGWRILDVGCGVGALADCVSSRQFYTGIDVSRELICEAKNRFGRSGVEFYEMDVRSFMEGPVVESWSRRFDLIVGRSVDSTIGANLPVGEWDEIKRNLRRVASRHFWIEYDDRWEEENRPMRLSWTLEEFG